MSVLSKTKKALTDVGLGEMAKSLSTETFHVKAMRTLIKDYKLDILTGENSDELLDDPDNTWHEFVQNILQQQDFAVTFKLNPNSQDFSLTNLNRNLSEKCLKQEEVAYTSNNLIQYFDADSYMAEKLQNGKAQVLAITSPGLTYLVIYLLPFALPKMDDINRIKDLADVDSPSQKQQEEYSQLYQTVKKQYEGNKHYLLNRETLEQKRVLFDKTAQNFVNLVSCLRVMFG